MGHRSTSGTGALRAMLALCAAAVFALALAPSALAAAPPLLWQAPPAGEEASSSGTGQTVGNTRPVRRAAISVPHRNPTTKGAGK